jgi:hypothetical protein
MLMPLTPPPQYDHPYAGPVEVDRASAETVQHVCGVWELRACAIRMPDKTCLIVLLNTLPASVQAAFRRHEEAHCNGWRADHPGGTR